MTFQVTIAGTAYPNEDAAREAINASGVVKGTIMGGLTPAGTQYVFAINSTAVGSIEEAEQKLTAAGIAAPKVQPIASAE